MKPEFPGPFCLNAAAHLEKILRKANFFDSPRGTAQNTLQVLWKRASARKTSKATGILMVRVEFPGWIEVGGILSWPSSTYFMVQDV